MSMTRRGFLIGAAAAAVPLTHEALAAKKNAEPAGGPVFISTWPFGKLGNDVALKAVQDGASTLDAVEQGVRKVEASGNSSVGLSGRPNAAGVSQLDACIMWGPGHQAGSVAGIEGIVHPITAARRVMEKTPHVLLVGEGARMFALEQGLESIPLADDRYAAWKETRVRRAEPAPTGDEKNHDTIALVGIGSDGHVAGGCSTSGLAGKLPGRVGDSPILGSGLYVDEDVGAAGATGVGENVMRYCATFLIVEYMAQGRTPEEACVAVIERIARKDPNKKKLHINFVAVNRAGAYGAAGTDGFSYSVTTPTDSLVSPARRVHP